MKSSPFITVVMPCYNGERFLRKSLESFASQEYSNKQIVIVDGKSTDKSHQIISEFIEKGYPIIWDKTPDSGISSAINIGLMHLKNDDIFAYLGSDDILLPNILSQIGNLFDVAKDIDGLYFDSYSYLGETGKLTYRKCPTSNFTLKNLLKLGTIAGLQNVYIKGSLVKKKSFDEKNRYSMDYDLYIKLLNCKVLNFTYVPFPSTINMMHGNLSTKFEIEGRQEAIKAAIRQVGYKPTLIYKLVLLYIRKSRHTLTQSPKLVD